MLPLWDECHFVWHLLIPVSFESSMQYVLDNLSYLFNQNCSRRIVQLCFKSILGKKLPKASKELKLSPVCEKGTIAEQKKVLIDELNFNITILKHSTIETTTIAQSIRLCLLSCSSPRVESKAQHLRFFQFSFELGFEKGRDWPILKTLYNFSLSVTVKLSHHDHVHFCIL